ncbi:hypothetical protein K2P97_08030 [bacterium]|nr:hypothetical protein [bacterium]
MRKLTANLGSLSIFFSFLMASSTAWGQFTDIKQVQLSEGQCFGNPTSKVYLKNLKGPDATLKSHSIIKTIDLSALNNNSQTEYYFCQITCQLNNRPVNIWATHSDSVSSHNDMNGFVCAGARMEQVPIQGTSLTTYGPVIYPFSAFESNLSEIQTLMKSINYKLPEDLKTKLNIKMNTAFVQMGAAYLQAQSQPMNVAGATLLHIGSQKAGYEALLKHYVDLLKKLNGKITPDFQSSDYFILMALQAQGKHLNY